jgi:membrane AbrB-like protein
MRPALRTTTAAVCTLCSGLAGGALFNLFRFPMPWLLGAIFGAGTAAVAGLPAGLPRWLREGVLVVLGLMIGSTVHHATLAHLSRWPISMAAVALYVAVVTGTMYLFLRRFAGFDPVTAYFASAPGGFMAMTVIGGAFGGRERNIALTHGVRVVLVVFTIVFSYHLLLGVGTAPAATAGAGGPHFTLGQGGELMVIGGAGWALGSLLRLPASAMLGPLLLMAVARLSSLVAPPSVPQFPLLLAEAVLGCRIGADFAGVQLRELARGMAMSLAATVWMLVLSLAFSLALRPLTGLPLDALFLALSPGGLTGVSVIALALGIQPAFVTAHNLLRLLLILLAGPVVFRLTKGRGAALGKKE